MTAEQRCANCEHHREDHDGRGGRCTVGRQKDTATWRCDCSQFIKLEIPLADREPRCANCGTTGADFAHRGHAFCCECMSELCSWLLDGGTVDSPSQFAWIYADTSATVTT